MFHNKITNAGFGTWKRGAAITNPKNVGVALEVTGDRSWKDFEESVSDRLRYSENKQKSEGL